MKTLHQFDQVFDSQAIFRKLLEAMSQPTQSISIRQEKDKLYGDYSALLALGMTLLDNEATFCVCDDPTLAQQLSLLTQSQAASVQTADYLFFTDPAQIPAALAQAKCGTLMDPHQSATLLIRDNDTPSHQIALFGPGIDGATLFACTETMVHTLALRDKQLYEYPTGIDLIFVTDAGDVTCIPRLVQRRESPWHM